MANKQSILTRQEYFRGSGERVRPHQLITPGSYNLRKILETPTDRSYATETFVGIAAVSEGVGVFTVTVANEASVTELLVEPSGLVLDSAMQGVGYIADQLRSDASELDDELAKFLDAESVKVRVRPVDTGRQNTRQMPLPAPQAPLAIPKPNVHF